MSFVRVALGFVVTLVLVMPTQAEERLVFISAFAKGESGAIHAYRVNSKTAKIKLLKKTTDAEHPFFLALSPNRKFLYSIHAPTFGGKENEMIAAYGIVGDDGDLKLINRQSALGTAACYLDVDAAGKTVFVANYSSGSVASLPVNSDGGLGKAASFIQHKGNSVNPARQKEPHAHCIVVGPKSKYVFAADLGIDKVLAYSIDSKASKMTPAKQPFVTTPAGAGPRHLTFDRSGKHMYVVNELANTITHYAFDSGKGELSQKKTIATLPADFKDTSHTADIKVTPDNRYVYATNRGHDSLAAYRRSDSGELTLIEIVPSRGKGPQNLAITPDGRLMICANMAGHNVALFKINADSGKLTATGDVIKMTSPSCIMIR